MSEHNTYLANIDAIPDELKAIPQWCVFSVTPQASGKLKKVPLVAGGRDQKAQIDNPRTWRTYEQALRDAQIRGTALGFGFTPDLGLFFIDADDALDRDDVTQLVEDLDTYTELSVSGNGLHIIGRGRFHPDAGGHRHANGHKPVERYPLRGGRWCLMTGNTLEGLGTIQNREAILHGLFPPRERGPRETRTTATGQLTTGEGNAIIGWAKTFWVDGQRNHMAMYLSGVLATSGVAREQGVRIIERCASDDTDPGAKVVAAHHTYDEFEDGRPVSGWQGLHDELGLSREDTAPLDMVLAVFKQRQAARPKGPDRPDPLSGIRSAKDLMAMSFPPTKWAVPDVIPEGATMLVGAPKKGKSWLLLNIGLAIAYGGKALGKIDVEQGEVLMLCLEDSDKRLQERLGIMLQGDDPPPDFHYALEWPRIDEGGGDDILRWLDAHPRARMVGIDVLVRMRPPRSPHGDVYQADYALMSTIKKYADQSRVPFVIVHHSRKAKADDPFDTISGTNGLAGAADTALILNRESNTNDASLYLRGRDVEEENHAIRFDPVCGLWVVTGEAPPPGVGESRAEIITVLRKGAMSPKEVADALLQPYERVKKAMRRMYGDGQLKASHGRYWLPEAGPNPPPPQETRKDGQVVMGPWGA